MCLLVCLYVPCFIYHTHLAIATHFHIFLSHFLLQHELLKITTAAGGQPHSCAEQAAAPEASGDLRSPRYPLPLRPVSS